MGDLFAEPVECVRDNPLDGLARTYSELFRIVTHPAFRIGFLDARAGRPINHFSIAQRIAAETPDGALRRLGYGSLRLEPREVEVAQVRYEEGRLSVLAFRLRCKAWGHPDFPPAAVLRFIEERAALAGEPRL